MNSNEAAPATETLKQTILQLCWETATEDYVFHYLCSRGLHDRETVDACIDELLDAGKLHPSMRKGDLWTLATLQTI